MRVAFVVANYPPQMGGVERHLASLAKELLARDHEVTVFNLEARGHRHQDGVRVVGLGRHLDIGEVIAVPDPNALQVVTKGLKEMRADVVSVHTRFFPATWLGIAAARRVGLPTTLTEHGSDFVAHASRTIERGSVLVDKTAGVWSLKRATALLAVSSEASAFCERLAGRRARVCGNGVDVDWWRVKDPSPRRELVFVGRVVGTKGWRTFLDVAQGMPPEVTARILGDGPEMEDCRAEIQRRGLAERVRADGQADREAVRSALAGAVYVNPTTHAEGMQTTLLEAAVAGARVVTFEASGVDDMIDAGAHLLVVPRGDAVALREATRAALDLPPARSDLSSLGWPAVTDRYLETWDQILRR